MTAAVDDEDTQDRVSDYNRVEIRVASNTGDSGVAMMAVAVEDGGSR
jgi:hypothetical protein